MTNLIIPFADTLTPTKGIVASLVSATPLGEPHECLLLLLADLNLPDEFAVNLCKFSLEQRDFFSTRAPHSSRSPLS